MSLPHGLRANVQRTEVTQPTPSCVTAGSFDNKFLETSQGTHRRIRR